MGVTGGSALTSFPGSHPKRMTIVEFSSSMALQIHRAQADVPTIIPCMNNTARLFQNSLISRIFDHMWDRLRT